MGERVTFIGLTPGGMERVERPFGPGGNGSGQRLAEAAGVGTILTLAATRNLFPEPLQGRIPTGKMLRQAATEAPLPAGRVILLGREVGSAYRAAHLPPFAWERRVNAYHWAGAVWVSVLPHPSGRNRWWNRTENRRRARIFLRRALGLPC
jgi:hypothetical protein